MIKKKYPKPKARKLDQEEVRDFLKTIDFQVKEIRQEWRHLIAFGDYKGKPSVFKLATTKKTSNYTRNEYYWNSVIAEYEQQKNLAFRVPKNYDYGEYKESLFYFICEMFPGETLDKKTEWPVEKIAQMAFEIINVPEPTVKPLVEKTKKRMSAVTKLIEPSIEWASQVKVSTDKYLQILEESKNYIREAPAHGDFTVRAMFEIEDKIGIIDGEHYGQHGLRYYDPAWFYLRTRLEQKNKKVADRFLLFFKELLKKKDQNIFWQELKPVLTQRFIGHLWGAKDNKEDTEKLLVIGKEILEDKITSELAS